MAAEDAPEVASFHASLVKKLQSEIVEARKAQEDITKGSRLYWQRVQAVHQAVLLLMDAQDLPNGLTLLQEDVARLLGVDALELFTGNAQDAVISHQLTQCKRLPGAFAGEARDCFVLHDAARIESLFPQEGALMHSVLCLPLPCEGLQAMLALAVRGGTLFENGLALEPYVFLASCLARKIKRWLNAKP